MDPAASQKIPRSWRLVLFGAPGVGKGTQGELLSQRLGIRHISTGDLFRAAGTRSAAEQSPAITEAMKYMRRGDLVPDATVWALVREQDAALRSSRGFLLDGFPRTLAQAGQLKLFLDEAQLPLTAVLDYEMPPDEIVVRLSGRRICAKCRSVFHVAWRPPKLDGACDECGGSLYQRDDDHAAAIAVRLEAYQHSTAPLIQFYRNLGILVPVNAVGSAEDVFSRTMAAPWPRSGRATNSGSFHFFQIVVDDFRRLRVFLAGAVMPSAILFLLSAVFGFPLQSLPGASVKAGGHTYQLFCAQQGELMVASETGICDQTESGGVQRFEVRNEAGDVQFAQDAPDGHSFTYVAIFRFANAGEEILDVDTSQDDLNSADPKPVHVLFYFQAASSGLVTFSPALTGIDGFTQIPGGVALSQTFNAGLAQFSVLLTCNSATHRIEVMPDQPAFPAFPPRGRQRTGPSAGAGEIHMYSAHDSASNKTDVKIAAGHAVKWWQAPDMDGKPATGQVVTILAAWAPVSLKPADNQPAEVKMVYFDSNNLWLQIEVDGHTGWVRGVANFRMIGLEMAGTQR